MLDYFFPAAKISLFYWFTVVILWVMLYSVFYLFRKYYTYWNYRVNLKTLKKALHDSRSIKNHQLGTYKIECIRYIHATIGPECNLAAVSIALDAKLLHRLFLTRSWHYTTGFQTIDSPNYFILKMTEAKSN